MSDLLVQDTSLTAVADALRAAGGTDEALVFPDGFVQAAEELKTVYDTGYDAGKEDGSTFYNDYWDFHQENGTKTNYNASFSGTKWIDSLFKPKYDITPTEADSMFMLTEITDVNKCLQECGKKIDLSTGSLIEISAFMSKAKSVSCPCPINVENVPTSLASMFYNNSAIQEVHFTGVKAHHTWASTFQNCYALTHLTIDGVIGATIILKWSNLLTDESVQSVINALADLTGETAKTITFHATVKGKLTDEQIAQITAKNWTLA